MKKSFTRFALIASLLVVILFMTASAASALRRNPGDRPREGGSIPPIVSTNIGPVVTAQMPSPTPKP